MAFAINQATMLGTGSSLTLNGSTFGVGVQGSASALKSVGSGLPSGVTVSGNAVTVKQAGAVLSDYDFRGYSISVQADNVTIKNSLFNAVSYHTIGQASNATGLKVLGNTFDGQKANGTINGDMVMSENAATISNNEFINLPADAINTAGGLIEHNYFSGASYQSGAHADAISVHRTVSPLTIRENYIDFVKPADAAQGTNAALKIVSHFGTINDVTIDHNVAIGGGFNAYVGQDKYAVSNVKLTNNLMGLSEYGDKEGQFLMPGDHGAGFTMAGNTLFSGAANTLAFGASAVDAVVSQTVQAAANLLQPQTSSQTQGWTQPVAATQPVSPSLSTATISGTDARDIVTGTAGHDVIQLNGGSDIVSAGGGDDIIIPGAGKDWMSGQGGNDTFLFTALSDSRVGPDHDVINDFGFGRDKIDLHHLADSTGETLAFNGTGVFSGRDGEVRAYASGASSFVEVDINGDKQADFQIETNPHVFTASDFIL
jgi:serralysin